MSSITSNGLTAVVPQSLSLSDCIANRSDNAAVHHTKSVPDWGTLLARHDDAAQSSLPPLKIEEGSKPFRARSLLQAAQEEIPLAVQEVVDAAIPELVRQGIALAMGRIFGPLSVEESQQSSEVID